MTDPHSTDTEPDAPDGPGATGQEQKEKSRTSGCGGTQWEHVRDSGRRHRSRRNGHRKERILHTRISEQLSEEIRAMADDLRVPVSNLVRNVLEEAFSVVEQVSEDLGGVLDDVLDGAEEASERYSRHRRGSRRRSRRHARSSRDDDSTEAEADVPSEPPAGAPASGDLFAGIVAWQPVVLHAPQFCARTGASLAAGERAYAAIGAHGLTGLYVREDALPVD